MLRLPSAGLVLGAISVLVLACDPGTPAVRGGTSLDTMLSVGGTQLFVHREGSGEEGSARALVIVHGGPLLDQRYLREPLEPLADRRELVFYDQRLSGRSDGRADSASIRIATFVQDLEDIRTALDLGRIDLLAHSWGGLIGLAYAIEHPEAVGRLVLVSPMPPSATLWQEEQTAQAAALEPGDTAGIGALRRNPGTRAGDPAAIEAVLRHTYRSEFRDPSLADSLDLVVPPDYLERSRRFSAVGADLARYDFTDRLPELTASTLLIYGEDEVGAALGGEALRRGIPDATLIVLDDTGHFAFLESPQRFLEEVRSFLAR